MLVRIWTPSWVQYLWLCLAYALNASIVYKGLHKFPLSREMGSKFSEDIAQASPHQKGRQPFCLEWFTGAIARQFTNATHQPEGK